MNSVVTETFFDHVLKSCVFPVIALVYWCPSLQVEDLHIGSYQRSSEPELRTRDLAAGATHNLWVELNSVDRIAVRASPPEDGERCLQQIRYAITDQPVSGRWDRRALGNRICCCSRHDFGLRLSSRWQLCAFGIHLILVRKINLASPVSTVGLLSVQNGI